MGSVREYLDQIHTGLLFCFSSSLVKVNERYFGVISSHSMGLEEVLYDGTIFVNIKRNFLNWRERPNVMGLQDGRIFSLDKLEEINLALIRYLQCNFGLESLLRRTWAPILGFLGLEGDRLSVPSNIDAEKSRFIRANGIN
jgi:hypothetical protein